MSDPSSWDEGQVSQFLRDNAVKEDAIARLADEEVRLLFSSRTSA